MRMIDRLAVAAAIGVRHAGAYADLLASDLEAGATLIRGRVIAASVMGFAILLAVSLACVWVLAATWDTPQRTWAIGGLLAAFVLIAGVAFWRFRTLNSGAPGLLAQTSREWAKDRRLLEELLGHELADSHDHG